VIPVYPHPYFVGKFLIFLSLRAWLRRKIVTTKKFPAKSSRIRSYVDDFEKVPEDYCAMKRGNYLQALAER
jgi:hypothetical protein